MNYYPHHIGDFNSATRHLTRLERGIYRDMLDMYYEKELPLPADQRTLFRRLLIVSTEEITAAQQVLEDFFLLTDAGWVNERCDREIEEYRANVRSGNAGARARAWGAAEKVIKSSFEVGDIVSADAKLAEFVRKWGDTPESLACAEMVSSLKRPPPQSGFDFGSVRPPTDSNGESFPVQSDDKRGQTAIDPRTNRGVFADRSRMGSAETNQNQNQNHNHNQVNPQQPPTLSEDCARGAVALSIEFRRCGVKTTPANPLLIEMAAQGVTVETVSAACDEARRSKGDSISLGYVKGILERWSREAAAMKVAGASVPKKAQAAGYTASRMATIAGLTGEEASDATGNNIIDITPSAVTHHLG